MSVATQNFAVQKELLETRLAALVGLEAMGGPGLMQNAQAQQAQMQAQVQAQVDHQVKALRKALDRLSRGEYGYCRICGADIDPQQLRDQPENPFCPSCSL